MKAARPLLLLDVDGVLAVRPVTPDNTVLRRRTVTDLEGGTHQVWLDLRHPALLAQLVDSFEIVWATGWQHEAPRLLGPLLGLPPLDVIEFTTTPQLGVRIIKLPDVIRHVGQRAVAWVDDELTDTEVQWAHARTEPTLLVHTEPAVGLTEQQVTTLLDFAVEVSGSA